MEQGVGTAKALWHFPVQPNQWQATPSSPALLCSNQRAARTAAALQPRLTLPPCPRSCLQCGSCWAFAATAAIESKYMIQKARTLDLSEQQVVDCVNSATDASYYSNGCSGGWPTHALSYAYKYSPGQGLESAYPYKAATLTCNKALVSSFTTGTSAFMLGASGYTTVQSQSAAALMTVSGQAAGAAASCAGFAPVCSVVCLAGVHIGTARCPSTALTSQVVVVAPLQAVNRNPVVNAFNVESSFQS